MTPMKTALITVGCLLVGLFLWKWSPTSSPAEPSQKEAVSGVENTGKRPKSFRFAFLLDLGIQQEIKEDRLARIEAATLTKPEIDELFELFNHRPPEERLLEWASVLNETMELILREGIGTERITDALLAQMRDEKAPVILRDFAAQHLGDWIATNSPNHTAPREQDPEKIASALTAITDLAMDPELAHTESPGTMLRILGHMHRNGGIPAHGTEDAYASVITPDFTSWMDLTIAGSNPTSLSVRSCVIDAAGLLEIENLHAPIRALAQDAQTPPMIRLTSLATLGHFARPDDREFLASIATSDSRLRYAAQSALQKISQ